LLAPPHAVEAGGFDAAIQPFCRPPETSLTSCTRSDVYGKSTDGVRWAISPDGSDKILQLLHEKEFGLLVDLSSDPTSN
jgi:hypothetical protein